MTAPRFDSPAFDSLGAGGAGIRRQPQGCDGVRAGILSLEGKWWDGDDLAAAAMNRLTASAWSLAGQPADNETCVTAEPA